MKHICFFLRQVMHRFFESLYLFTASEIHQVKFAAELLLGLGVLLFDVYQENTVTPGAVLIHV